MHELNPTFKCMEEKQTVDGQTYIWTDKGMTNIRTQYPTTHTWQGVIEKKMSGYQKFFFFVET